MPREFDFPRTALPPAFHYVGPLRGGLPRPIAVPVGSARRAAARLRVARYAAEQPRAAVSDVRRGVPRARRATGDQPRRRAHGVGSAGLPGDPLVVSYAPQIDLLARAALTITHAGLNTVLDSMANGVPVVAVPITYEQPAIARRVEWAGAGPDNRARTADARTAAPGGAGGAGRARIPGCCTEAGGGDPGGWRNPASGRYRGRATS